tara:strand:- start:47 stop:1573 length:1527 start_codon:yes stop_codon:yes gene_type:complete
MAYIGLKPTAGENNSFRILDTLSSFTATFDGSDSTIVSLVADTIKIPEHRFLTGQRVTYNDGGGTAITGLADGVYYAIKVDRNLIQLASSLSNANSGTQINLTGLGAGSSHTLNVAFDGVNTKFKITHDSGTHAKVTRASQLMISINGVLQQPHDSASPSSGIGIASDSVLVFSAAPATTDVVFGSIMSTNLSSFEISDNLIDNFTGNGSTTNFTMSKSPPDARNILVTLDGVVQYPSDTSTTRSYSVTENTLSFTNAPPNGVLIQVRHIGFSGSAASGGVNLVTSVFGRGGDVVLTNSDDVTIRNLVATGATFSGSVSIGGTLTYEDVKNVDSLGIVTARIGVKVPAGEVTVGNNIQLGNAGVATATLFSGPSQIGIQSGGVQIGAGITQLNFIGVGNTFAVNGTTVNVSIAGGAGAGGTWGSNAVGVHTDKIVGINTSTIAGSATSEGALQVTGNIGITEGLLTLDSNLYTSVSVPSGKNALLIGPTTVAVGATIDIATGSTLVVV